MSEDSSSQEKDLPASERKIQKSREDGDIARSREFSGALVALATVASLFLFGSFTAESLVQMFKTMLTLDRSDAFDTKAMPSGFVDALVDSLVAIGPLMIIAMVAAIIGGVAIGGFNFSMKAVAPKASKLNPIKGLKNIFSMNSLAELAKGLLKVFLIGGVGFFLVIQDIGAYSALSSMSLKEGIAKSVEMILFDTLILACIYMLIGGIDAPYQMWRHAKKLRMSLEELKKENKETEGDPHMKGRIRAAQREMSKRRMMASIPGADVIVTNPTHFAVAIKYEKEIGSAPKVVAKGVDEIAQKIKEIAREAGVSIVEAPPLARALYKNVEIDQEIPDNLFKAVAKVLAYVYALSKGEAPKVELPTDEDIPTGMDPGVKA